MATATAKKFGLDNPKLGDTFETGASKYEYKLTGGRLQPVRIGSPTTTKTPAANGGIVDTTKYPKVNPALGGSVQAEYPAGSNVASIIKTKETADSKTQVTRSTRENNGVKEIFVNGKWIPRTPLSSAEAGFPDPSKITDVAGANKALDDIQNKDFNNLEALTAPPTKDGVPSDLTTSLDYYSKILNPTEKAPEAFNATKTLEDLRKKYGVADQEAELNKLKAEEDQLLAEQEQNVHYQQGKPVSMGVIQGRVSEVERAAKERLDFIGRQKQIIYDGLQTAYGVIQQTMDAGNMDYQNAQKKYNDDFNRNLQIMGVIRGVNQDALTAEEKAKDNALSNLQIMFNNLSEGNLKFSDMSPEQQTAWQKIEAQAGLPIGTIEQVGNRNPSGKIISSSTRDVGGVKYFDAIVQMPDGSLKVDTVKVGSTGGGAKGGSGTSNKINEEIIKQRAAVIEGTKSADQAITDLQLKFGNMTPDQVKAAKEKYFSDIE